MRNIINAIEDGYIRAVHDISKGGLLIAALEMAFTSKLGLSISLDSVEGEIGDDVLLFSESSGFLLEVDSKDIDNLLSMFEGTDVFIDVIGNVLQEERLIIKRDKNKTLLDIDIKDRRRRWETAWYGYLR